MLKNGGPDRWDLGRCVTGALCLFEQVGTLGIDGKQVPEEDEACGTTRDTGTCTCWFTTYDDDDATCPWATEFSSTDDGKTTDESTPCHCIAQGG